MRLTGSPINNICLNYLALPIVPYYITSNAFRTYCGPALNCPGCKYQYLGHIMTWSWEQHGPPINTLFLYYLTSPIASHFIMSAIILLFHLLWTTRSLWLHLPYGMPYHFQYCGWNDPVLPIHDKFSGDVKVSDMPLGSWFLILQYAWAKVYS